MTRYYMHCCTYVSATCIVSIGLLLQTTSQLIPCSLSCIQLYDVISEVLSRLMDVLPISLFSVVIEERRNGTQWHVSPREQRRAKPVVNPASKQSRGEDRGKDRGVSQPMRESSAVTKPATRVVEKSRGTQQEAKRRIVEKVGEGDDQLIHQVSHEYTLTMYCVHNRITNQRPFPPSCHYGKSWCNVYRRGEGSCFAYCNVISNDRLLTGTLSAC